MIRWAATGDIQAMVAHAERMHRESNYSSLSFSTEKMTDTVLNAITNGFAMVAEIDGVVVGGMLGGLTCPCFSDDVQGFEYGIYLDRSHRSGLIAAKLISAFTTWCIDRGAKQIRVGNSTGHDGVSRLYERLGYRSSGQLFFRNVG